MLLRCRKRQLYKRMQFKGKQFEDLSIKKLAVQCFLLGVFNFQFTMKCRKCVEGWKVRYFLEAFIGVSWCLLNINSVSFNGNFLLCWLYGNYGKYLERTVNGFAMRFLNGFSWESENEFAVNETRATLDKRTLYHLRQPFATYFSRRIFRGNSFPL